MLCKTTAQVKQLDHQAIEQRGIPSMALMENAAAAVTAAVLRYTGLAPAKPVLVLCGPGNNGGDGFACARQLLVKGLCAEVYFVGDAAKMTVDTASQRARFLAAGGRVTAYTGQALPACACIVDALFGVGLCRPVKGRFAEAVQAINAAGAPVVACDIPSGVQGDSGQVLGVAVRASTTVTFTCAKPGLLTGQGAVCAGRLEVADIGIPADLLQ